jgi:protein-S-isoprenylcysteine O-methyltransferase Ste14
MQRLLGIGFGAGTQALFLATLWPLYRFLRNDWSEAASGSLGIDAALALGFAVPHSILLHPRTRRLITRWLPSELYGCLFCLATCASLWLQLAYWRGSPIVLWSWPEVLQPAVVAAFLCSWGLLFYGLSLTGLEYQTGIGPWWRWIRGQSMPRRQFVPRGAYRFMRHPVYLSFLGLVWFTPVITADRAVLIGVWTAYVFVGSYLKDRRLAQLLGEPYVEYIREVPAYPLVAMRFLPTRVPDFGSDYSVTEEPRPGAKAPMKAA